MVMNRYIWQIGTIATLPAPSVTDLIAPTIQHYLADPLPPSLSDDSRSPGRPDRSSESRQPFSGPPPSR